MDTAEKNPRQETQRFWRLLLLRKLIEEQKKNNGNQWGSMGGSSMEKLLGLLGKGLTFQAILQAFNFLGLKLHLCCRTVVKAQ